MTPDTPRDTRMDYVYHVYFSQTLVNGQCCNGDAILTLEQPIQYVSDLELVKRLVLEQRPGRDVVIKSWRLLMGENRPDVPESDQGIRAVLYDKLEGYGVTDTPKAAGESFDLMQARSPRFASPSLARLRNTLFPPLPRPQTVQEWADLFREKPARIPWPGVQLGHVESRLDALRFCPELQAQGEGMNATLLDRLHQVRQAPDLVTARELADHMIQNLVEYVGLGLVPGAACDYLSRLASALRVVRMSEVTP